MQGFKSILLILLMINIVACSSIEKMDYQAPASIKEVEDSAEPPKETGDNRFSVIVTEKIDGDTLVINFQDPSKVPSYINQKNNLKVRIPGIDSPESTTKKQLWGVESAAFTAELLSEGNVEVEVDEKAKTDKYGRYLFHVFANGKNVAAESIKNGYSRVAYVFDDYKYISEYKVLEDKARENKLNIHSIPNYVTAYGYDMSVVDALEKEEYTGNLGINFDDITSIMEFVQDSNLQELFGY
ncbi:thermonuclease family protein [Ferdinandcohnia sp. SAFN-114]|uniref:thermonuclease family protein n=1 Tax=Ferdinandcohnia sp. SAFN-114 TaxID=3387275 RepID=UPI003F80D65E